MGTLAQKAPQTAAAKQEVVRRARRRVIVVRGCSQREIIKGHLLAI
jgi:hypothetical protein